MLDITDLFCFPVCSFVLCSCYVPGSSSVISSISITYFQSCCSVMCHTLLIVMTNSKSACLRCPPVKTLLLSFSCVLPTLASSYALDWGSKSEQRLNHQILNIIMNWLIFCCLFDMLSPRLPCATHTLVTFLFKTITM